MSLMLSPCTGICTIAAETSPFAGHCLGCGRTLVEIGAWRDLGETERRTVMAALPARLRRAGQPVPKTLEETTAP